MPMGLSVKRSAAILLLLLALLWPALAHQRPAYFFDSVAYLNVGNTGLAILERRIDALVGRDAAGPPGKAAAGQAAPPVEKAVVSIRSITYTLFVALLAAPDGRMFGVILVQAIIIAALIAMLFRDRAPAARSVDTVAAVGLIAVATSAPWFASYAMPDVLAGALILVIALLGVGGERLRTRERLFLTVVGAFAVTAHASHVLLGGALVVAGLIGLFFAVQRWTGPAWRDAAWIAAPLALGVAATLLSSAVGVGEASVAPKRLPFALSRSIEDGPARWYLERNCAKERYTICRFFTRFPEKQAQILFGPGGINARASAAEMAAMRGEEALILRRTFCAYPGAQLRAAAANFGRQLIVFGLQDTSFGKVVEAQPDGKYVLVEIVERLDLRDPFTLLIYAGAAAALVYLASIRRSWSRSEVALVGLLVTGLVANAAIMGILSAVADRYQSRVIWVLPVMALAFWLARRTAADNSTTAKVALAQV